MPPFMTPVTIQLACGEVREDGLQIDPHRSIKRLYFMKCPVDFHFIGYHLYVLCPLLYLMLHLFRAAVTESLPMSTAEQRSDVIAFKLRSTTQRQVKDDVRNNISIAYSVI